VFNHPQNSYLLKTKSTGNTLNSLKLRPVELIHHSLFFVDIHAQSVVDEAIKVLERFPRALPRLTDHTEILLDIELSIQFA